MSELQYAGDNCIIAHTFEDLQDSADNFSRTYSQFGLNINIAKTKVLLQPRPGHHTPPEDKITIRGLELENADYFTYLGSILDENATAERCQQQNRSCTCRIWKATHQSVQQPRTDPKHKTHGLSGCCNFHLALRL
ncbi:uncharacterized protein LOC143024511 [Oratosquilla oratoria]|uniref:uncharacterized protein LOC143024511 n=1 Tax=Oratosquilla oratoria TaxID=337810 RepID=UPI003F764AE9